jgi:hypothetical protein
VQIGLVEVRPKPEDRIFGGAPSTYSNVLSPVGDEAEYQFLVEFGKLGLEVVGFEYAEPLERRGAGGRGAGARSARTRGTARRGAAV